MIIVTLGNSYSLISGLNDQQFRELKKILSYRTDERAAFFAGGYGPREIPLISKRGEFPTGLYTRVQKYLNNMPYEIIDKRVMPKSTLRVHLKPGVKPYEDQELAAALGQVLCRGAISMPTGSGKSMVIALLAAHLKVKTLVVVPTLEIKAQLTEAFKTLLNGNLPTVENIDSPRLKKMTGFDCLIIDEAHHTAAKTYRDLNKKVWNSIYYRFFLTATPFRNNANENILFESIAGDVIFELTYRNAVRKGYIVPVEAYTLEIKKQPVEGYTWSQVYKELVVYNKARNAEIVNLILALRSAGKSTLCLVKEIAHGEILAKALDCDFANGMDEYTKEYIQKFNLGKTKVLVGTTGVLGEGIDTKPCEYVIIAGLGKAKSQFMQQVGRTLRKHPGKESGKVIIIKDPSHKWTKSHFREQVKFLLDCYGVIPVRLDL